MFPLVGLYREGRGGKREVGGGGGASRIYEDKCRRHFDA